MTVDETSVHELAERFGVDVDVVRRSSAFGLLPREPDGSYGGAAARRVSLLAFALRRGIDAEQLLAAMESYGDLFVSFDAMGPTPTAQDRASALADVGLDEDTAAAISAAGGIEPGDLLTLEDIESLRSAKRALDLGLPLSVLLQLIRVFADNTQRLAEAENRIFHDHVHEQFRAQGLAGRELMEATASISTGLLELVEPTVLYFHRRAWAAAAQHDFLRHLTEDDRPLQSSPGAAPCAVMFADLSGFTPLTAAMGDQAAAEVLSRFAAAVRRITATHDGRVVKQIGDAFMIVFEQRRDAALCGVDLLDWCGSEPRFPPLHVGAHAGEVLFHDGDYVGAAVNLAARVASITEPSQFLATDVLLADLALPDDLSVRALGPLTLKGVAEPVPVSALASNRQATPARLRDPVCGMALNEAAAQIERGGQLWSFCSQRCADVFRADPDRYAPSPTHSSSCPPASGSQ